MPSISAITATGSGSATAVIRSISPAPATASTSPSISAGTFGRSASTMRGVNALDTSAADPGVIGRLHVEDAAADQVPERRVPGGRAGRPISASVARWW